MDLGPITVVIGTLKALVGGLELKTNLLPDYRLGQVLQRIEQAAFSGINPTLKISFSQVVGDPRLQESSLLRLSDLESTNSATQFANSLAVVLSFENSSPADV